MLGLTGGIGSGKKTVARMFEELGASLINSDELSREVMKPGKPAFKQIVAEFGNGILKPDGTIDRKRLGDQVFTDASQRNILESIVHPEIFRENLKRVEELESAGAEVIISVAALMIEVGTYRSFGNLILVTAPEKLQLERVMKRDGLSEVQAMNRLRSQMPISEKIKFADYVIDNSGDLANTRRQVLEVWSKIPRR